MTQEIILMLDNNLIQRAERLGLKKSRLVHQMLSDVLARVITTTFFFFVPSGVIFYVDNANSPRIDTNN